MTQGQFLSGVQQVWIQSFSSPSCFQGWRTQSLLLFTHSWRENNWIHTFPKGISAMRKAIILVQDWTRVAMSTSYDNNHYTTGTAIQFRTINLWKGMDPLIIPSYSTFSVLQESLWHQLSHKVCYAIKQMKQNNIYIYIYIERERDTNIYYSFVI